MANSISEFEKKKTDMAWTKLKARLEQDNLLEQDDRPKSRRVWTLPVSIAAMIAIAVSLYWVAVYDSDKNVGMAMLSQENRESSALVTTLSDGSVVFLGKDGRLEYPDEFVSDTRSVSLRGEAFFDIAKNREKPFIINTPETVIEVLGTSFSITSARDIPFRLNVRRGKVKVSDRASGKTVYVEKGECAYMKNGKLVQTRSGALDPLDQFTKDFRFKDATLCDIVDVINGLSSKEKIELAGNIDKRRLTVAFSGESTSEMAQLVTLAMGLSMTENGDIIILAEK